MFSMDIVMDIMPIPIMDTTDTSLESVKLRLRPSLRQIPMFSMDIVMDIMPIPIMDTTDTSLESVKLRLRPSLRLIPITSTTMAPIEFPTTLAMLDITMVK